MLYPANLRAFSRSRCIRSLGLPLASTVAVIALTGFTAPAKALSFNWQFSNTNGVPVSGGVVKGTISGLLDNTSQQFAGLTVTVTSAPNSPNGGWFNTWVADSNTSTGFSVVNGQITAGSVLFLNAISDSLYLNNGAPYLSNSTLTLDNFGSGSVVTYTPQASTSAVPGPLPILGAASALGWSRRVRNRLRNAQRSAR